jgi:regulator of protease activity HflC (stomatin/prohibitin superfamily)
MNPNFLVTLGAIVGLILLGGGLYGCPQYNVYSQRLQGEAELARAESNRQVAVREAQAKKDAASLLAEAEIARAKGVAEANHIIGASLKDNEAYLRYLWIDKMEGAKAQVIYVPTETGLPILEASRKPGAAP